jgi:hypothetical protein
MPTGTLLMKNATLTYGGMSNTHAIVEYRYIPPGSTQAGSSGPVQILPGEWLPLTLPSGVYNLYVVFDNGRSERLQSPPDQVDVYAGETRTVLFMPE